MEQGAALCVAVTVAGIGMTVFEIKINTTLSMLLLADLLRAVSTMPLSYCYCQLSYTLSDEVCQC